MTDRGFVKTSFRPFLSNMEFPEELSGSYFLPRSAILSYLNDCSGFVHREWCALICLSSVLNTVYWTLFTKAQTQGWTHIQFDYKYQIHARYTSRICTEHTWTNILFSKQTNVVTLCNKSESDRRLWCCDVICHGNRCWCFIIEHDHLLSIIAIFCGTRISASLLTAPLSTISSMNDHCNTL